MQIIKKGEQIRFDVAGTRTIHVDHRDLDSVEEAKAEIKRQIQALEKDSSKIETPISLSLDLQILKQSENSEERSLEDLLTAVSELKSGLTSIEKRLGSSEELIPPPYFRHLLERYGGKPRLPPHIVLQSRDTIERVIELESRTKDLSMIMHELEF